jgi:hypothetical protein
MLAEAAEHLMTVMAQLLAGVALVVAEMEA